MNTHQPTIDRIKELVPRLAELRFGYEVHLGGFSNHRIVGKDKDGKFIGVGKNIINDYQEIRFFSENKIKTIIGFDPDLDSVLEAISKDLAIKFAPYQLIHLVQTWEKGKTFSEQSEETKQEVTDIFFTQ